MQLIEKNFFIHICSRYVPVLFPFAMLPANPHICLVFAVLFPLFPLFPLFSISSGTKCSGQRRRRKKTASVGGSVAGSDHAALCVARSITLPSVSLST